LPDPSPPPVLSANHVGEHSAFVDVPVTECHTAQAIQ
jgi:hypothetical protein